jgi:hypothetical protein
VVETAGEPFCTILSDSTKVLYGFKDARVEIKVKVGAEITVPISAEKVELIKKAFDAAYLWALKPEDERKAGTGEFKQELDSRGRAKWGFPDGRVELQVRPLKFGPWLPPFSITQAELKTGKPVIDQAYEWSKLPEEVRGLQGV